MTLKWKLLILAALAFVGTMFTIMFIGPHMIDQPSFRAYQAVLPSLPPGVVPVTQPVAELPGARPEVVAADPQRVTKGQVYFQYYCVFCHGPAGDGGGPVGQSFFPPPADLRSARVGAYSDAELLNAILNGTGHGPVMQYTLRPQHRWYLVAYVRTLQKQRE